MNVGRILKRHGVRLLLGLITALSVTGMAASHVGSNWPLRLLVFGGTLALVGVATWWEMRWQAAAERDALQQIERLCQLEPHDLSDPQTLQSLPRLAEGNPWRKVLSLVQERLVECGRKADEAEHAWTACEVRLRRLDNDFAQLREVLDRVTDPILTTNHYDEIQWMNQAARDLFGSGPDDSNRRKLTSVVACKPLVDLLTDSRRRKYGSQRSTEMEISGKSGAKRWYRISVRSLTEATGDESGLNGAQAVLTDISTEKEIQQRHAEFVSSAAHELKTPLASIRAYVELLQDEATGDPATQEEFLDVISTQAERLQRLIENLLNIARIEAGVVRVEKHNLSLNEVLEQALHVVQPSAEQKPLELVKDLSPMHLGVFVDRDMTLQAAINLLSNAVKYTPAQGKVTLRSRLEENAAVFEVEDTGVGLTPEDCRKVFERFYRVRKDQQMAQGTGLGLSLVKQIVEDVHGGKIAVASQVGKGSVFRVTLPTISRSRA